MRFAWLAWVVVAACTRGGIAPVAQDVPDDAGAQVAIEPDAGAPPDSCHAPEFAFAATLVVDRFVLPTETEPYLCDVDFNGAEENAFALLLPLFTAGATSAQSWLDQAIGEGRTTLLATLWTNDWTDDSDAQLQLWRGEDADDDSENNLNGDGTFIIAPDSPDDAVMDGEISAGEAWFGLGRIVLDLPLAFTDEPLRLALYGAQAKGPVASDPRFGWEGAEATLCGGLPRDVFDEEIVPLYASWVASTCPPREDGQCNEEAPCDTTLALLDDDGDCVVSEAEIRVSRTDPPSRPGDVDLFIGDPADRELGSDGDPDSISLGLGFTAVRATFDHPGPPASCLQGK